MDNGLSEKVCNSQQLKVVTCCIAMAVADVLDARE